MADKLRGGYAAQGAYVENKPGAGGRIAIDNVRLAADDGSVLLVTPHSMLSIYPHTYPKLSYRPFDDLAPVSLAATFSLALAVGPGVPASVRDLKDFIGWCKANPQAASYGSPAAGSIPHFMGVLLEKASGVEMRHIPYRGSVPGVQDMLGGQIPAMMTPLGDCLPHLKSGRARVLATSSPTRSRFTPDCATFAEQGYPAIRFGEWYAFFAPARTPRATMDAAAAAIGQALRQRDVIDSLATFGLEAGGSSPAELGKMLRTEYERWGPIVKQIGFTAES
ncbi:tripartite tricarboxylate transporter substrate-binding protein [Cupriavidus sp. D39]|uniref:tripartite tricarboxylate transporter substrate-binding protein n=1 Tax=Cupriavidus sp. D39 TaxID=2997877 RepID=UPI002D1E4810|nr:tripartite tricarboxylate transporter substrate-binding protein [Cupriavidus sp. D39]